MEDSLYKGTSHDGGTVDLWTRDKYEKVFGAVTGPTEALMWLALNPARSPQAEHLKICNTEMKPNS